MKLLYIKRTSIGSEVIYDDCIVNYNAIPERIINQLCLENMSTYLGRRKATQIKYGIQKLTPIIVDDDVLLFPTHSSRDYENVWINFYEITNFNDEGVIFRGGKTLICKLAVVKRQLKKCQEIAF